jgi:hypothetical protein
MVARGAAPLLNDPQAIIFSPGDFVQQVAQGEHLVFHQGYLPACCIPAGIGHEVQVILQHKVKSVLQLADMIKDYFVVCVQHKSPVAKFAKIIVPAQCPVGVDLQCAVPLYSKAKGNFLWKVLK